MPNCTFKTLKQTVTLPLFIFSPSPDLASLVQPYSRSQPYRQESYSLFHTSYTDPGKHH